MAGTDYQGIALVIAAIGVALPAILVAINSFRNASKLDVIAHRVDGVTEMIAAGAHREGVIEGGDAERANPTPPK